MRLSGLPCVKAALLLGFTAAVACAQPPAVLNATPPAPRTEAYFLPGDDAAARIVSALRAARDSIRVQAFLFTSRRIADALLRAHRAGRSVEVIVDAEQLEKGGTPVVADLLRAGVPVYVDAEHSAAHNKVMVIDAAGARPVIVTGSYNFTVAAQERNAENLLVIRDDRRLAAMFQANWENHMRHSTRIQ